MKRPQSAKSLNSKKSKSNLLKTLSSHLALFGDQNLLKGTKSGGITLSRHASDMSKHLRQQQHSSNSRDRNNNSFRRRSFTKDVEAFPINDDNSPVTARFPAGTAGGKNQNNLTESMKEASQEDNLLWVGDPDEVILAKCTMLIDTEKQPHNAINALAAFQFPSDNLLTESTREFRPRRHSTIVSVLDAVEAAKQVKKNFPSVPNLSSKVITML